MSTNENHTPRKKRSDAGQPQLTHRDLLILPWIAHQYAVRTDQAQVLLSRYPGKPMKEDLISDAVLKDQVHRWSKKARWMGYKRFLAEGPGWLWLTKKGLQTCYLDKIYTSRPPAATRLYHMYAVNEVRLFLEDKGYVWVSERQIRSQLEHVEKGESSGPIPDGYLEHPNGKIAIEVELTPKKPQDLLEKLHSLAVATEQGPGYSYGRAYPAIWFYVPDEGMKRAVEAARAKLRGDFAERISVLVADLDY